ncbi:MAG: hypothetical protein SOI44_02800 [Lactimicrobium sp.]|jgi:hypothetical protein|uniref:hypothetical protein n=1 Tax=Lactimicrobium sp. TaxID=2563780 RepID=UPI002F35D3FB
MEAFLIIAAMLFLTAGLLTLYIACWHPPLAKPKQMEKEPAKEADHDSLALWQKRVDVFRMAVPDIAVLFQFQALGHGFLVRYGKERKEDPSILFVMHHLSSLKDIMRAVSRMSRENESIAIRFDILFSDQSMPEAAQEYAAILRKDNTRFDLMLSDTCSITSYFTKDTARIGTVRYGLVQLSCQKDSIEPSCHLSILFKENRHTLKRMLPGRLYAQLVWPLTREKGISNLFASEPELAKDLCAQIESKDGRILIKADSAEQMEADLHKMAETGEKIRMISESQPFESMAAARSLLPLVQNAYQNRMEVLEVLYQDTGEAILENQCRSHLSFAPGDGLSHPGASTSFYVSLLSQWRATMNS